MDFGTADRLTLTPVAVILEHIHVNLPVLMERVAGLLQQYKGTGVSQTVLNSRGLGGIVDVATANQLLANSDRLPQLRQQYAEQSRRLDTQASPQVMQGHQDITANFMNNSSRLTTAFYSSVSRLNGPITKLSDGLTTSIEKFLNGRNPSVKPVLLTRDQVEALHRLQEQERRSSRPRRLVWEPAAGAL